MHRLIRFCCAASLGFAAALSTASALAQDAIFRDGLDPVASTDAEAARFLNQATFGATAADITRVRQIGLGGWIDEQLVVPRSLHRRPLEEFALTLAANTTISRDDRLRQWYRVAAASPDQLRQRMAYSLSQILVVSDLSDALSQEPLLVADWNDMLARHAFGNYRDLLIDVSRHPAMGRYLTHLRNRKLEGTIAPDENYAREIMQLFSIGLFERELDWSPILVGGQMVPTYDNEMIATLARVFTGLSHQCTGTEEIFPGAGVSIVRNCGAGDAIQRRFNSGTAPNLGTLFFNGLPIDDNANNLLPADTPLNRGLRHPDLFRPMVCYPRYHDAGRQSNNTPWTGVSPQPPANKALVLAGQTIQTIAPIAQAAGTAQVTNCNVTGSPTANPPFGLDAINRQACVDYCENSVDGAVSMLFNHPNTSSYVARQLIQRFVTSNPSPAYIRRVACVFEGSTAPAGECPGPTATHARGDLRRVITAVLLDPDARRAPNAAGQPVNFGKPREPILKMVHLWRSFGASLPALAVRGGYPTNVSQSYGQRPLGAPSVFNFYEPEYKQAGQISAVDINGNPSTTGLYSPEFQIINEVSIVDTANDLYRRVCLGYGGSNCSGAFAATPPNEVHLPPASIDALPIADGTAASDQALIEALNLRLLGGSMSGTMDTVSACPPAPVPLTTMLGTGMKGRLYGMLRCTGFNTLNATQDNRRRKALMLIHMILISPEYATQR
jgi:uncharacterized protein (DUF1800 family)